MELGEDVGVFGLMASLVADVGGMTARYQPLESSPQEVMSTRCRHVVIHKVLLENTVKCNSRERLYDLGARPGPTVGALPHLDHSTELFRIQPADCRGDLVLVWSAGDHTRGTKATFLSRAYVNGASPETGCLQEPAR